LCVIYKMKTINDTLKYTSMISVIIFGLLLIYQGIVYLKMSKTNEDMPGKLVLLSVLFIVTGIIDIVIGVAHLYL